jgi:hypothetical protein
MERQKADANAHVIRGSHSTPGARRGVKLNGTSSILPCPCGKLKRPSPARISQILGEGALRTNYRMGSGRQFRAPGGGGGDGRQPSQGQGRLYLATAKIDGKANRSKQTRSKLAIRILAGGFSVKS